MGYRVAVVGATGNVGREMLAILAEREFKKALFHWRAMLIYFIEIRVLLELFRRFLLSWGLVQVEPFILPL